MSSANQTILWNTVNRIPAFLQLSPPKRELEFKKIVEYFYREHVGDISILSTAQLQELNRKTVLAFLPSASTSSLSREKPPLYPSTLSARNSLSLPSTTTTESNMFETRQEKQERAFQERQNMYAQMTEKPNLPSPDIFKEKEPDEKITNMDELIENYQKQRNLEIPIIPTPSSSSSSSSVFPEKQVPSTTKRKITFLEETQINSLEIQDLSIEDMRSEGMSAEGASEKKNLAPEKRNLAWNINLEETRVIEDSYLQELEKRIAFLEKQIAFLTERKTQEKNIQTESEENESEVERKEIEEIIESVILSIEQQK
jgi:hypothetical protein